MTGLVDAWGPLVGLGKSMLSAVIWVLPRGVVASGFARNVLTLGGGMIAGQGIVIALSPILARLYEPTDFGLFMVYTSTAAVLSIAATAGYENAVMLPRAHRHAAALLAFVLLLIGTVTLALAVPLILLRAPVATLLGTADLGPWMWFLPLSVALLSGYQALRFWAMRQTAFADVARNTVLRLGLGSLLAVPMGLYPPVTTAPESGLILAAMLADAVGNLSLLRGVWRRERRLFATLTRRRMLAMARRWRHLALMLTLSQGIAILYQRLPVLAVAWLFGPSIAGLYAWAERFAVLPSQVVADAIGDVYRQRATAEFHAYGCFDGLMLRTLKVTTALAVLPYAFGIWLAPMLFAGMFGPSWREAGEFASVLLVGGCVSFVASPVDKAAVILGRTRYILLWQSARLLGKVVILVLVVATDAKVLTFLWLLVALRITLYLIDVVYELYLARGDASGRAMLASHAAPRLSSPTPSPAADRGPRES